MNIRKLFEDYQAGTHYVNSLEMSLIAEYAQKNSIQFEPHLYRGVNVDMDFEISLNDTVKFTADSFSEAYNTAKEFAINKPFGVIYEIEEGKGFPLFEMTDNDDEYEWLIFGEYEVVSIEKERNPRSEFGWLKIVTLKAKERS